MKTKTVPPIRKWTFYRQLKLDEVIRKTDIFKYRHAIDCEPIPNTNSHWCIGSAFTGDTYREYKLRHVIIICRLRKQYQKTYGTTTNKTN